MANINCPLIGKWADSGSITSLSFNTDGTIDTNAGTNQFGFLVWEINSDHKLVTLDDTGAASATPVVYDFTLSGNSLTLSGSGPLNGNYTGTPTPAPLSMDNELLGIWTADVTGRDMVEGDWGRLYTQDGVVAMQHTMDTPQCQCDHKFSNVYLVRLVTSGRVTKRYLVTCGQHRFGPSMGGPILATFTLPGTPPPDVIVTEQAGGSAVWEYTKVL